MSSVVSNILTKAAGILCLIALLNVTLGFVTILSRSREPLMAFTAALNAGLIPFIAAAVLFRIDRWLDVRT